MKKFVSGLLIGILITLSLTTFAAVKLEAIPSPFPILVDGVKAKIEAYSIKGSTYIKLADLKAAGVDARFNSDKKQIEINSITGSTTEADPVGESIKEPAISEPVPEISSENDPTIITRLQDEDKSFEITTYKNLKAIKYKEYSYVLISQLNMGSKLKANNGIKVYKYSKDKDMELILETENADYKYYVVYKGACYVNTDLLKDYLL